MNTKVARDSKEAGSGQEIELDVLTEKYINGELTLDDYKDKISKLEVRLDLRKIASKLHPIFFIKRFSE